MEKMRALRLNGMNMLSDLRKFGGQQTQGQCGSLLVFDDERLVIHVLSFAACGKIVGNYCQNVKQA